MTEVFCARRWDCEIESVPPGEVESALRQAVAANPDVLLAGGGDGTIRSAAKAILGKPVALAVIPLGTMNRFARDLRIPLEPMAAAAALADGGRGTVDVAEMNGEIFLCNSMMGLPPEFSARRHALRGQGLLDRLLGYYRGAREFISSRHKIEVDIDDGQQTRRVRALSVIVSNNLYGEEIGPAVLRASLSEGVLGLYIARHPSGAALAGAFIRAMLGRWKADPHLEFGKAKHLTITTGKSRARVSNDGEVQHAATPLDYRIRPAALIVLTPEPGRQVAAPVAPGEGTFAGAES